MLNKWSANLPGGKSYRPDMDGLLVAGSVGSALALQKVARAPLNNNKTKTIPVRPLRTSSPRFMFNF